MHVRFDDLDLVARPEMCWIHGLQFLKIFYYILVHCSLYLCMLATDIEEIMHSKLCVTHVYLRDIINTFFFLVVHWKVSNLGVCCSCSLCSKQQVLANPLTFVLSLATPKPVLSSFLFLTPTELVTGLEWPVSCTGSLQHRQTLSQGLFSC